MCGIVGYVGYRPVQDILLSGLEKLEYRGYDSAGISLLADGRLDAVRAVGNLANLRAASESSRSQLSAAGLPSPRRPPRPASGTRAGRPTGQVTQENAHPHFDTTDRVHIVVNGIVENYMELKEELLAEGAVFTSETDAEVIAHLVSRHKDSGLVDAVREASAVCAATTPSCACPPTSPTCSSRPPRVPARGRAGRRRAVRGLGGAGLHGQHPPVQYIENDGSSACADGWSS
jgi:glucosamine--fructose-6-phosphate aminotransferase (isomerizing)